MSEKNQQRLFNAIGIVIIIALTIGLVKFNFKLRKENEISESENIEAETIDIEEEDIEIPPIKAPKEKAQTNGENNVQNNNDIEVPEYKEEVKEIDGNKVLVKPTPPPQKKETPEAMKKSTPSPKPKEPPKLKEDADETNSEEPPTYEKEEEPKEVKGGTGSDGVLRDLNGNPIPIEKGNGIDEVDGSDLGDGEWGTGDKF